MNTVCQTISSTSPLVSILIPCFNGVPWVHRSIETALGQTWPNKEVIVLDDGSTDDSLKVIRRYAPQVCIATQPNGGQNVSRNRLTELSRGEWLVYLDADDELAPDNVAQKLKAAANADAIYGTMEMHYYEGGQLMRTEAFPAECFVDPLEAAFLWKYPNTSSFMFRKSAVLEVGGWNETIKNCTDYDLYFRLLLKGKKLCPAPQSLTVYRQWSQAQAVYENSERRILTRLNVMWNAIRVLEKEGRLTTGQSAAFGSATLAALRILYQVNSTKACEEHRRLTDWLPDIQPSANAFPFGYRLAYQVFGFRYAEHLADWLRPFKRSPAKAADFNRRN